MSLGSTQALGLNSFLSAARWMLSCSNALRAGWRFFKTSGARLLVLSATVLFATGGSGEMTRRREDSLRCVATAQLSRVAEADGEGADTAASRRVSRANLSSSARRNLGNKSALQNALMLSLAQAQARSPFGVASHHGLQRARFEWHRHGRQTGMRKVSRATRKAFV